MKYFKPVILSSTLAAMALICGCAGYDTDTKGSGVVIEPSHNFLGIVKTSPNSYRYVDPSNSVVLRTNELWCRRDFSGDNISLFWGLININDY